MKITLVIPSMGCGGAERVMSIIANYWASRGEDTVLITFYSADSDFYTLDPRVKRVSLGFKYKKSLTTLAAIKNNYIRIRSLRKAIKETRPEVVLSFMDTMNVTTLIATLGLSLPIIISDRIDPRELPPNGMWKLLRRWTYSWASAVVILTEELRSVLGELVSNDRLHVVPNPALPVPENLDAKSPFDLPLPFVVAMGRLCPQKGFDLLLDAFARCKQVSWSLVILGEGPEREHLESLTKQLGLGSRVHLPGNISEPSVILHRSGLFVLSSRFEGFPNALVEAMCCGLPVVSFDCPTGPHDIIRDGHDGILVSLGDVDALATEMDRLMGDEKERKRLGDQARNVTEKFSTEEVIKKWDRVIDGVLK